MSHMECSRPFWDLLAGTVDDPGLIWDWAFCPYTITGLGEVGVGLLIMATGFVGIKNWSESWTLPMTWLALTTPVLAAWMLPGTVIRRIAGFITIAFALLFIGVWWWWGRS